MSTKVKVEGFIIQSPHWAKNDPRGYGFCQVERDGSDGYTTICPHTLEFELPSREELVPRQVSALRKRLEEVRAENYERERQIEGQIANLLSLEAPK